ncbi:hypothetical protein GMST_30080 [Geomonas silvestris]|uniref:Uncharacterized protein n=1 Tax=Geomonas silvestris TaxID=2740184 RepID=A0A6V8MLR7_9BACT|nr:tetratricopeptide repeat protein [Geomonas silvestris]GFO60683.1 hypothetical protein GMST_30080 [Geomonas silvestris]
MIQANAGLGGSRKELWIPLLLIACLTLAVYYVSFSNGFVWDDDSIIVKNSQTLELSHLPDVLFSPDVVKPYYRPLNRASYLFDYWAYGMNPLGFHAVNIAIHLVNALLLFLVGCRLLPDRRGALFAALLFAVHPVNAEAVNFISARNTLLSLGFSLAAFLWFLEAKGRWGRPLFISALFFFGGLLSKETGLMLLAVLPFYLQRSEPGAPAVGWRERVVWIFPYLFFLALYLGMRSYSLQGVVGIAVPAEGLFARLAQNYYIIPRYLGLLLAPYGFTIFHTVPKENLFSIPWLFVAWAALMGAVFLILRGRHAAARFGLLWFAANYVPISNVVPIPSDYMTERFLYLPAVGFFLLSGAGFCWLQAHVETRRWAAIAAGVMVICCAGLTVDRNLDWRDDLSLFGSAVRNNPDSVGARFNYGTALMEKGDLAGAQREWQKALAIDPQHTDTLAQLGTLAATQGDLDRAESYYRSALDSPSAKNAPGASMAHFNLAKIYEKKGLPREALRHYRLFLENVNLSYEEYRPLAERRVAALGAAAPAEAH